VNAALPGGEETHHFGKLTGGPSILTAYDSIGDDGADIVLLLELTLVVRGCASVWFDSDSAMNMMGWRGFTAGDETNATHRAAARIKMSMAH
jgi:hypothetical protein